MAGHLDGKVALVTGGSRGIGAAIAERLAADGASVALTYAGSHDAAQSVVRRIEAAGGRALAIRADAADAEQVRASIAQTVEQLGRLDVLVNNAGMLIVKPIDELTLADFDRMVAVNVRGVFVASQEALRHMGAGGRIVNIGSINTESVPFTGGVLYVLTKAAVSGLTASLARDVGSRGITVNALLPGPVDTDMNPAVGAFADEARARMVLGRYGSVAEIAGFVSYLTRPEAGYVTGSCLRIDGGYAV
jgi:3-oxoacyl-[acyl-carrier protein] reductase